MTGTEVLRGHLVELFNGGARLLEAEDVGAQLSRSLEVREGFAHFQAAVRIGLKRCARGDAQHRFERAQVGVEVLARLHLELAKPTRPPLGGELGQTLRLENRQRDVGLDGRGLSWTAEKTPQRLACSARLMVEQGHLDSGPGDRGRQERVEVISETQDRGERVGLVFLRHGRQARALAQAVAQPHQNASRRVNGASRDDERICRRNRQGLDCDAHRGNLASTR